jgi:hypothetical protein
MQKVTKTTRLRLTASRHFLANQNKIRSQVNLRHLAWYTPAQAAHATRRELPEAASVQQLGNKTPTNNAYTNVVGLEVTMHAATLVQEVKASRQLEAYVHHLVQH